MKKGNSRLDVTKVGYQSNDVQSAWRAMGSPAQLTKDQVATLRKACSGEPTLDEKVRISADGRFTRRFQMRENDVYFVELIPARK